MGNNSAWTAFEAAVVGLYDLGKIDKAALDVLAEPYRGSDIDPGGSCDLHSKRDKLGLEEIVVSVMAPKKWAKIGKLSQENGPDGEDAPYDEQLYEAFSEITDKRWGWR